jgi:hypothetical protein
MVRPPFAFRVIRLANVWVGLLIGDRAEFSYSKKQLYWP